jgi:hypothetical protein
MSINWKKRRIREKITTANMYQGMSPLMESKMILDEVATYSNDITQYTREIEKMYEVILNQGGRLDEDKLSSINMCIRSAVSNLLEALTRYGRNDNILQKVLKGKL